MDDQLKKKKETSHFPSSKYEKVRRDRLNFFIAEMSTYLPEQNPSKTLSKVDILEKVTHLIKRLLNEKEKLLTSNSEDTVTILKDEIKELKCTVSDLKTRICTLNKILKEADVNVPIDLAVSHLENFTPHLKYTVIKKAYSSKYSQTDHLQEVEKKYCAKYTQTNMDRESKKKNTAKDEDDSDVESAAKLISFAKNLKAPLKEINNICLPPPPTPQQFPPTQIIVVPYVPHYYPPVLPKRPAATQLTFSNKRPITSYLDFKKCYNEQQERYKKNQKRKRKIRKCVCKSAVLKKSDGSVKKVLKLCGNKLCKNKAKIVKLKEQQKKNNKVDKDEKKSGGGSKGLKEQIQTANASDSNVNSKSSALESTEDHKAIGQTSDQDAFDAHSCSEVSKSRDAFATVPSVNSVANFLNNKSNETLNQQTHKQHTGLITGSNENCKQGTIRSLSEFSEETGSNANHDNSKLFKNVPESKRTENAFYDCNNFFNPVDNTNVHSCSHYMSNSQTNNSSHNMNQFSGSFSISNAIFPNSGNATNDSMHKQVFPASGNTHAGNNHLCVPSPSTYTESTREFRNQYHQHTSEEHPHYSRIPVMTFNAYSEIGVNHNDSSQNKPLLSQNSLTLSEKEKESVRHCSKKREVVSEKMNFVHKNSECSSQNQTCNIQSKSEDYSEMNSTCNETNRGFNNMNGSKYMPIQEQSYLPQSSFSHSKTVIDPPISQASDNVTNVRTASIKAQEHSFSGFYKQRNIGEKDTQNIESCHEVNSDFSSGTTLKRELEPSPYSEPFQEKSSCYFEAHPNALHFPYVSNEKSLVPQTSVKSFDSLKTKQNLKNKSESNNAYLVPPKLSQTHDISQNIFETNKENSFDFLFGGKQIPQDTHTDKTSVQTPQKNKRKPESSLNNLMTEEVKPPAASILNEKNSFLPLSCLDEMRFSFVNSEFSNDIFSLQGHVGSQNMESVSPTAAFLLSFPVVSSKNAELLADNVNLESGNASTPSALLQIGNIESLSQDLFPQQEFGFKGNIKGLFDPFYPSCIGAETNVKDGKLNFDFITDNISKDEFNKQSFASNLPTSVASTWSTNLFSTEHDANKKKVSCPNTDMKSAKLNFDFNTDICKMSDTHNLSFSNVTTNVSSVSTANVWSSSLFKSSNESNKKNPGSDKSSVLMEHIDKTKKTLEVKFLQNSQTQESNSKGSQTNFTYASNSEMNKPDTNHPKAPVNWMTSCDKSVTSEINSVGLKNQEMKKPKSSWKTQNTKLPFTSMEQSLDFLEKQNKVTSWSPTKSMPLLPPLEPLVPSTLPSLMGDMHLGTKSFLPNTSAVSCLFNNNMSTAPASSSFSFLPVSKPSGTPLFPNADLSYVPTSKSNNSLTSGDKNASFKSPFVGDTKHKAQISVSTTFATNHTFKTSDQASLYSQDKNTPLAPSSRSEIGSVSRTNKISNIPETTSRFKKHGITSSSEDNLESELKTVDKVLLNKSSARILSYPESKENIKKNPDTKFSASQCYHQNVSSGTLASSNFLSVSQLVDPVKSEVDPSRPKESCANQTKHSCNKKDFKIAPLSKEDIISESKNNYSTEALLFTPQKLEHLPQTDTSLGQTPNPQYKVVETKSNFKRKRTDSRKNTKVSMNNFAPTPIPFTSVVSMCSIPTSSNSLYYSSSNYYEIPPYQPPTTSFSSSMPCSTIFNSSSTASNVFNSTASSDTDYVSHTAYYPSASTSNKIGTSNMSYLPTKSYSGKNNTNSYVSSSVCQSSTAFSKSMDLDSHHPTNTSLQSTIVQSYLPPTNHNFFSNPMSSNACSDTCARAHHHSDAIINKHQANVYYQGASVSKFKTPYSSQTYDGKLQQHLISTTCHNKPTTNKSSVILSSSGKSSYCVPSSISSLSCLPSSYYQNVSTSSNFFVTSSNCSASVKSTDVSSAMYSIAPSWHTPPGMSSSIMPADNTPASSSISGQVFSSYSSSEVSTASSAMPGHAFPKYSCAISTSYSSVPGHTFSANSTPVISTKSNLTCASSFATSIVTSTGSLVTSSTSVPITSSMSSKMSHSTPGTSGKVPFASAPTSSSKRSIPHSTSSAVSSKYASSVPSDSTNFYSSAKFLCNPPTTKPSTFSANPIAPSIGYASSASAMPSYTPATFSYTNSIVPSIPYASANMPNASVSFSNSMMSYSSSSSRVNSSMNSGVPVTPFSIASYSSSSTTYTPVSSSVTNFNLSTIFPEINDKQHGGGPVYNYHAHSQLDNK